MLKRNRLANADQAMYPTKKASLCACPCEATVGIEPTMTLLQRVALATWPRRPIECVHYSFRAIPSQG
jgi:hypothetical protein